MATGKKIIQCVTSDIIHDQRILRIYNALLSVGYQVEVVGRQKQPSKTKAPLFCSFLPCYFKNGFLFYLEYNLRLLFFLLRHDADIIVSNDVDTMVGAGLASRMKRTPLVFDAHEYFSEVPELIGHPFKQAIWRYIELFFMKYTSARYTVGGELVKIFEEKFRLDYDLVRNVPFKSNKPIKSNFARKVMLYQGALNPGRCLSLYIKSLIELKEWNLWIVGDGPLVVELKRQALKLGVSDRVKFYGKIKPEELQLITSDATVGLNLLEGESLNYYYSLANKFFDYVQAGVPSLNMDFPEYNRHTQEFKVGLTVSILSEDTLISAIKQFEVAKVYEDCQKACLAARRQWNWEEESKTLLNIYERLDLK